MLDIKFIRKNIDVIKEAIKNKNAKSIDVDELLHIDDKRRDLQGRIDDLNHKKKEFAEKLASRERLGMIIKDMAEVKIMKHISAGAFYPKAVPSSLVLIKQKEQLDEGFWKFLCSLKPNKNVSNQLRTSGKLGAKKIHQLTLDELKTLYKSRKS